MMSFLTSSYTKIRREYGKAQNHQVGLEVDQVRVMHEHSSEGENPHVTMATLSSAAPAVTAKRQATGARHRRLGSRVLPRVPRAWAW